MRQRYASLPASQLAIESRQIDDGRVAGWLIRMIGRPYKFGVRLLHTMIRVNDLDKLLKFYCDGLGMKLLRKRDFPNGEFTLAFIGYDEEKDGAVIELTHNWGKQGYDQGTAFGHLAISVDDIYKKCADLKKQGVNVVREPGPMKFGGPEIAFIEDPNGYKIELVQQKDSDALSFN